MTYKNMPIKKTTSKRFQVYAYGIYNTFKTLRAAKSFIDRYTKDNGDVE